MSFLVTFVTFYANFCYVLASYTTVFIDYPTDFLSSHCLPFKMAIPADISDENLIDFVEQDYLVDLDLNANDYGSGVSVSSTDTADLTDFEPDDDDIRPQEASEPPSFLVHVSKEQEHEGVNNIFSHFLVFSFLPFFVVVVVFVN